MFAKLFSLVALAISLSACNVVGSFNETNAQSEAVATRLEKEVGAKPQIAWHINNSTLTNVNVIFESKDVGGRSYNDLEPVVRKAVEVGFNKKPSMLLISVKSSSP